MKKNTTLIKETVRKELGITRDEYALCSFVSYRCADPTNNLDRWCNDRKEDIAEFIGISRRGLLKMCKRMIAENLIESGPKGWFRPTEKWIGAASEKWELSSQGDDGKMGTKFPKDGNKVPSRQELSSQNNGHKVPEVNKEDIEEEEVEKEDDIVANATRPPNKRAKQKEQISPPPVPARPSPKKPTLTYQMREVFETHYRRLFNDEILDWRGRDWKGVKGLADKLRDRLEAQGMPADDTDIVSAFDQFLQMVAIHDTWTVENNFTPPGINGQYQKLIQKILAKNNKATKPKLNARGKEVIDPATRLERARNTGRRLADEIKAGKI